MAIPAGTYRLGPDDGTLSLRTGRTGAAAKAGHDLLIHATSWEATLTVGGPGEGAVALDIDGGSLRVIEGTGGMKALSDDDRADIARRSTTRSSSASRSRSARRGWSRRATACCAWRAT